MKSHIISLLIATLISGCATIEHTSTTRQPIGQILTAGVGDVVLRVAKQRDLENIFGKADVFGRKTNEGFSELRFAGIGRSGEVVFYRKDVRMITNETTMSRTPISTTTGSANTNVSGSYYGSKHYGNLNANARTSYSSTTVMPASDFHILVPVGTMPIRVPAGETEVHMAGYIVEIVGATSSALEYRITTY